MASPAELAAMRRAIELSRNGALTTPPNPDVGCVILDAAGATVGEGWHERPGGPHAEITALAEAGERARGGTAVVTLEPCDHTGRTGPCTQALIAAGVARVVVAVADPNPVAAGGAATLSAHGVDVESGVLADEAAAANARWLTPFRTHRPFVVWKFAATLDGRSAAADGTSRWITGDEARADVHRLRAAVDTVIVGSGTVRADDPQLTARLDAAGVAPAADRAVEQPLRVVVDSAGRTPATARVRDDAAPTWIATAAEVGAGPDGRVDLPGLLTRLYDDGRRYVLLEGGPTLAGAFWRAGLIDRVVGYVAPALLGAGPAALADAGVTTIDAAIRLDVTDVKAFGPDLRITATPQDHRKA
ncbi:bifunctional diaminohydroxyphosphoribosylaminopyrimidine deaminase/5-amino-6-(5-phosphoribosylamino)uracil reductase RibD [Jiangella rhizosphaerae]|uniref:Riboflavin biosynthesis protein RibD n=1 Tax=Jiangella rhizosphaerae TaxID=2293569 RepID=A0A418KUF9_9ACTN|nr:bifunctional diaminohydroxyphosphoribosylaminopyrimidine deaminase/5-amino-6-(5-phosphoribosylamino)uracil reductase RibD [Jiangella rhizosphaerae]RIQ30204.1 bifunctional diaminohydroxyphosphoribosylaminopyrimidine deaminase/5-amino-6-(5-phosphoribosylamino)uracil reductase RibD [Jiangella rhizosphaerae]